MKRRSGDPIYRLDPYFFLSERRVWVLVSMALSVVGIVVLVHSVALAAAYLAQRNDPAGGLTGLYTWVGFGAGAAAALTWLVAPMLHHAFGHPRVVTRFIGGTWNPVSAVREEDTPRARIERELMRAVDVVTPRLIAYIARLQGRPVRVEALPVIEVVSTDEVGSPYSYQHLGRFRMVVPVKPWLDRPEAIDGDGWAALLAHELSHLINESGGARLNDARLVGLASAVTGTLASMLLHVVVVAVAVALLDGAQPWPKLVQPAAALVLASVLGGAVGPGFLLRVPRAAPGAARVRLVGLLLTVGVPTVASLMAAFSGMFSSAPRYAFGSWVAIAGLSATCWGVAQLCERIGRRQMEHIADEAAAAVLTELIRARRDAELQRALLEAAVEADGALIEPAIEPDLVTEVAELLATPAASQVRDRLAAQLRRFNVPEARVGDVCARLVEAAEVFAAGHRGQFGVGVIARRVRLQCAELLARLERELSRGGESRAAPRYALGATSGAWEAGLGPHVRLWRNVEDGFTRLGWSVHTHPPLAERTDAYKDPDLRALGGAAGVLATLTFVIVLVPRLVEMALPSPPLTAPIKLELYEAPAGVLMFLFMALFLLSSRRPVTTGSDRAGFHRSFVAETLVVLASVGLGATLSILSLWLFDRDANGGTLVLRHLGLPPTPPFGLVVTITGLLSGVYLVMRYTLLAGWTFMSGASLWTRLSCHAMNLLRGLLIGAVTLTLIEAGVRYLAGPLTKGPDWVVLRWLGTSDVGGSAVWTLGVVSLVFGLAYSLVVRSWPAMPRQVRCPEGHEVPTRWHDVLAGRDAERDWSWLRCPTCGRAPQELGPLISDTRPRLEVQTTHRVWWVLASMYLTLLISVFIWMVDGQLLAFRGDALLGRVDPACPSSGQRSGSMRGLPQAPSAVAGPSNSYTVYPRIDSCVTGELTGSLLEFTQDLDAYYEDNGKMGALAPVWGCGEWLAAARAQMLLFQECSLAQPDVRCDAEPTDVLDAEQACACLWGSDGALEGQRGLRLRAAEALYRRVNNALHGPAHDSCKGAGAGVNESKAWTAWHQQLERELAPRVYLAVARDLEPGAYLRETMDETARAAGPVVLALSETCEGLANSVKVIQDSPHWEDWLKNKLEVCVETRPVDACAKEIEAESEKLKVAFAEAQSTVQLCLDDSSVDWFVGRAEIALSVTEALADQLPALRKQNAQLWVGALVPTVRSAGAVLATTELWYDMLEEVSGVPGSGSLWTAERRERTEQLEAASRELHDAAKNRRTYASWIEPALARTAQNLLCQDQWNGTPLEEWYRLLACSAPNVPPSNTGSTPPACPTGWGATGAALCDAQGLAANPADPQCATLLATPPGCAPDALLQTRQRLQELLFAAPFEPAITAGLPPGEAARDLAATQLRVRLAKAGASSGQDESLLWQAYRHRYGIARRSDALDRQVPYLIHVLFAHDEGQGIVRAQDWTVPLHDAAHKVQAGVAGLRGPLLAQIPLSQRVALRARLDQLRVRGAASLQDPFRQKPLRDFPALAVCQADQVTGWRIGGCASQIEQAFDWWYGVARDCLDASSDSAEMEQVLAAAAGTDPLTSLQATLERHLSREDELNCDMVDRLKRGLDKAALRLTAEGGAPPPDDSSSMTDISDLERQEADRQALRPWWQRERDALPEFVREAFPDLNSIWNPGRQ